MSDLDDVSGREPASQQQPTYAETVATPLPEPVQADVAAQHPEVPQEDTDPVSGLRKALDEERGKRRKYKENLEAVERQMQAIQGQYSGLLQALQAQQRPQPTPQPAPDFFQDPDAAIDYRLKNAVDPLAKQQVQQAEQFSRMMAVDKFGEEVVNTAYAELAQRINTDPNARLDHQRIMSSPHPYAALVQWHKQQSVLKEVGEDPAAYRERVKAELLEELRAQPGYQLPQPPPSPGAALQNLPSNFAGARNAGTRTVPQFQGPTPLSQIFKGR